MTDTTEKMEQAIEQVVARVADGVSFERACQDAIDHFRIEDAVELSEQAYEAVALAEEQAADWQASLEDVY